MIEQRKEKLCKVAQRHTSVLDQLVLTAREIIV